VTENTEQGPPRTPPEPRGDTDTSAPAAAASAPKPRPRPPARKRKSSAGNRLLLVGLLLSAAVSLFLVGGILYTVSTGGGGGPRSVTERDVVTAEAAVTANAESVDARLEAGRANLLVADFDRAIAYADQALELQPRLADALLIKGDAYAGKGDDESAVRLYEEAVATNQPAAINAYLKLAAMDETAGRLDEAATRLESALVISPANASVLVSLGQVYAELGKKDEARNAFASSLNYVPDMEGAVAGLTALEYGPAKYDLALVTWDKGDKAGAEALMEQAVSISPDISWLQVAYGDFFAMLGDTAKAKAAYERALSLDPANTDARDALQELQ